MRPLGQCRARTDALSWLQVQSHSWETETRGGKIPTGVWMQQHGVTHGHRSQRTCMQDEEARALQPCMYWAKGFCRWGVVCLRLKYGCWCLHGRPLWYCLFLILFTFDCVYRYGDSCPFKHEARPPVRPVVTIASIIIFHLDCTSPWFQAWQQYRISDWEI